MARTTFNWLGFGVRSTSIGLAGALVVATVMAATPARASELRVEVVGLRSDNGIVHVALYATPDTFPKRGRYVKDATVRVTADRAEAVFENLAPGSYALAAFHDENANDQFDQGFMGLPLEGFGFSNGAKVFLGPPAFEEAAVRVDATSADITIRMSY